jgi:hypothetical protein
MSGAVLLLPLFAFMAWTGLYMAGLFGADVCLLQINSVFNGNNQQ